MQSVLVAYKQTAIGFRLHAGSHDIHLGLRLTWNSKYR